MTPTGDKAKRPAYQRIQSAIQKEIEHGELKPGDAVPSERQLAGLHGVSLMTARNALCGLERQGLVERRPGAGTFVAAPKISYNELMSTSELVAARGFSVSSRVICAKTVDDEGEIAAILGHAEDKRLVKLERLRQVEREPLAVETSYLAAESFGELATTPLERGSLFLTLANRYETQIAYANEEVEAAAANKRTARLLGIAEGAPLLRIKQVIYSTKGQAILYVVGLYRSDRHKLLIRRWRREHSPGRK